MSPRSYEAEWYEAIRRTAKFGLSAPAWKARCKQYLTDERISELFPLLKKVLGSVSVDRLAGQCLQVNWSLLMEVERWLGCRAHFTIGWVGLGKEREWCKFDDSFVHSTLKFGHPGGPAKIHAWLTLDSLEILDVTLMTSLAVGFGIEKGKGDVLAGDADSTGVVALKPMLVGPEFALRTGIGKLERNPAA